MANINEYFRDKWNNTQLQRFSHTYPSYPLINKINIFNHITNPVQHMPYEIYADRLEILYEFHQSVNPHRNITLDIIAKCDGSEWTGQYLQTHENLHVSITYDLQTHTTWLNAEIRYSFTPDYTNAIKNGYYHEGENYVETQTKLVNVVSMCEQLNNFENYDAEQIWANCERVFADIFLVSMIGKM